jgi:hypothetical protein
VLNNAIRRSLTGEEIDFERLRLLMKMAAQTGIALDDSVKSALRERLDRTMDSWSRDPSALQKLSELERLIPLFRAAPLRPGGLWQAQNTYYELMKGITHTKLGTPSDTWLQLFRSLGDSLGIAVPQIFRSVGEKKFTVASVPQTPELQLNASAE